MRGRAIVAGTADQVNASCTGAPDGGGFGQTTYLITVQGPHAVAAGQANIVTANTDPIVCVYGNSLFTGNHPVSNDSGPPCPRSP